MSVPLSQMWTVATYVLGQRLRGRQRYPLVLMLEPLFRCNLACAGCGKIQYPAHILRKNLSVEQCLAAVDECGAPMVSIPGGEPLMYPDIGRLVKELVARRKYVYLCTNAILLKEKLEAGVFTPSKYLSFSVHLDGLREEHDESVCRDGVYDQAVEGIREALRRGFRVTTNSTLFDGAYADPHADVLRRDDGSRRRRHDAVAGLQLRQGPGPGALPAPPEDPRARSARCWRTPRSGGSSISRRSSCSSSWASGTSSARRGACRPTTSSAGSARATSCRRATRPPSRT